MIEIVNIIINYISYIFAVFGGIIIIYGGLIAIKDFLSLELRRKEEENFGFIRRRFTSKIVLALEFFVAADLLSTILKPGLEELVVLGFTVTIRTAVGYFLDQEIRNLEKDKKE